MKVVIALLMASLCVSSFANTKKHHSGRCSGSNAYCNACSSCRSCKHCKSGGTCAVCKKTTIKSENESKIK